MNKTLPEHSDSLRESNSPKEAIMEPQDFRAGPGIERITWV